MGAPEVLKLSPSTATDFKSCPQLFKYRAIDRLPEPTTASAARGSLVHAVLERLFKEVPDGRTPDRAEEILVDLWNEVRAEPGLRPDGLDPGSEGEWLRDNRALVHNYFRLEDPRTLEARRLEWWVEYELADTHLRGRIDRIEVLQDGSWVLTDYKTGRAPGEPREYAASFGLRFYALVCWKAFRVIPKEIRLMYLADPAVLTFNPSERMLVAFERQVQALGRAIRKAIEAEDWRARPSPFCMRCHFQSICPAWAPARADAQEID